MEPPTDQKSHAASSMNVFIGSISCKRRELDIQKFLRIYKKITLQLFTTPKK